MVAAPGLVLEAAEGTRRGWLSSGICPDPTTHSYGYHMPKPLAGDYSLRGLLNVPVGQHCCAYDMQTRFPATRRYVNSVFERIREGKIEPSTAEMIGSWDGTTVWYWAWDRGTRIERYSGTGHDLWCHRSVFRSLATRKLGWLDAYDINGNLIAREEDDDMAAGEIIPQPNGFPAYPDGAKDWQPTLAYILHFTAWNAAWARTEQRLQGVVQDKILVGVQSIDAMDDVLRAEIDQAQAELAVARAKQDEGLAILKAMGGAPPDPS